MEVPKLREPQISEYKHSYTCKRWDIDVNGHMHNLNYINLAYEVLPESIYFSQLNNIEVIFKKQIKIGETIDCFYSNIDNTNIITIKNKDSNTINAIVKIF